MWHASLPASVPAAATPPQAQPPHAGLARETITLVVDGVEQELEIVRQERRLGGQQGYWVCPKCAALRAQQLTISADVRICARRHGQCQGTSAH
jgi:hypothetical protein